MHETSGQSPSSHEVPDPSERDGWIFDGSGPFGGYLGPFGRFVLINDCYDALETWVGYGHTNYRAQGKSTIDKSRGENIRISQLKREFVDYMNGVQGGPNVSRSPKPWLTQPILAELGVIR